MKKITLLLFTLLAVSLGYSQTVLEDFETPLGAGDLAADGVASVLQVANPDAGSGSGNESANVMEVILNNAGAPWQNGQLFSDTNWSVDLTDGNPSGNKIITVDVWSQDPQFILAKIVDGPSGAGATGSEVATDASHPGGGWANLSFDFSIAKDCGGNYCGPAFEVYERILFFPSWGGTGWTGSDGNVPVTTTYYDNITKAAATAGIDDISKISYRTHPNPTQDNWTIETQNVRISSITVFDVLGKSVMSMEPKSETAVIDGSSLKSGLYFAKVETAEGVSSLKLVKK